MAHTHCAVSRRRGLRSVLQALSFFRLFPVSSGDGGRGCRERLGNLSNKLPPRLQLVSGEHTGEVRACGMGCVGCAPSELRETCNLALALMLGDGQTRANFNQSWSSTRALGRATCDNCFVCMSCFNNFGIRKTGQADPVGCWLTKAHQTRTTVNNSPLNFAPTGLPPP